jgi:hypothetical protein
MAKKMELAPPSTAVHAEKLSPGFQMSSARPSDVRGAPSRARVERCSPVTQGAVRATSRGAR